MLEIHRRLRRAITRAESFAEEAKRERAKRGSGVRAGEVVITGTCVKPVEVEPGDRVTVEFPGLGEVKVAFD